MEEQPQAKRKRRPSVRLGEIGYAGPYDASELWLEAPRQRRKPSSASGKKAPRIRSLEHVAGDKAAVVPEEEWSVDEPAVASADEDKVAVNGAGPASTPVKELQQHVKRRSGLSARKPTASGMVRGKGIGERRLAWQGSKVRWKHEDARAPVDAESPENREEEEEEKESLPLQGDDEAPMMSSDSEEVMGSGSKGGEEEFPADDSGNGASDRSEEGDAGANPSSPCNSHLGLNGSADGVVAKQQKCIIIIPANPHANGDEMQGAIEDGPGQATGKGSSTVKQREGERRSGRQAARRSNPSRDTVSRDTGGEPSGRFQAAPSAANGTIVATPSSSQRVAPSLAAGVSGWLQDLGLGKYTELFELNEVDTEVLPLLTMDDLREMGVEAVGARRKMFTNIQELGQLRGV